MIQNDAETRFTPLISNKRVLYAHIYKNINASFEDYLTPS